MEGRGVRDYQLPTPASMYWTFPLTAHMNRWNKNYCKLSTLQPALELPKSFLCALSSEHQYSNKKILSLLWLYFCVDLPFKIMSFSCHLMRYIQPVNNLYLRILDQRELSGLAIWHVENWWSGLKPYKFSFFLVALHVCWKSSKTAWTMLRPRLDYVSYIRILAWVTSLWECSW